MKEEGWESSLGLSNCYVSLLPVLDIVPPPLHTAPTILSPSLTPLFFSTPVVNFSLFSLTLPSSLSLRPLCLSEK